MKLHDLLNNVCLCYFGITFGVRNPFDRTTLENKLNSEGVYYICGYLEETRAYSYAVVWVKGKHKTKKLKKLAEWFKMQKSWKYYYSKNALFKKATITNLIWI